MHFHNIFNNGIFDINSTMKYAIIFIPSHQKLRTKQFSLAYGILKYKFKPQNWLEQGMWQISTELRLTWKILLIENNSTLLGRYVYYVVEKSAPLSELASTLKVTLTCYPDRLYRWNFSTRWIEKKNLK